MFDNFQLIPDEAFVVFGSLAQKLIDKVAVVVGWVAIPKGNKAYQLKAEEYLIEQIKKDKNMPPLAKAASISNVRKIIRQYINQNDILNDALEYLNEEEDFLKIDDIDNDWLQFFFDKARNISKEDMKIIWAKLFAKGVKEPGSISRQLLHILSVIDQREASTFAKLPNYCVYINGKKHLAIYYGVTCGIDGNDELLEADIFRLVDIGLVQQSGISYMCNLEEDENVKYFGKEIDLKGKRTIQVGNVIFSRAGEELMSILAEGEPIVGYEEILSKEMLN